MTRRELYEKLVRTGCVFPLDEEEVDLRCRLMAARNIATSRIGAYEHHSDAAHRLYVVITDLATDAMFRRMPREQLKLIVDTSRNLLMDAGSLDSIYAPADPPTGKGVSHGA